MTEIKLGDLVKDSITGYQGVCIGITNWLNGCARIGIQSKTANNQTGLPVDCYWVDDVTVKVVESQVEKTTQNVTGGENTASSRNMEPKY